MKSVIYARVSTKGQADEGYSLPAQEKLALDYAERRGLDVVKKYLVPESASGKVLRLKFAEMMEYVKERNVNVILVEKVDRMTRNFKEAVVINDWIDENETREVHFVKENLVIHKNAKSHEKFQWDIKIVLAQNYIRNLGEEVKKAHLEKLRQGWLPLFRGKYGYQNERMEGGRSIQVIDEEYAPLIRRMFELYSTGQYSIKALAEKMHEEGLRTRKGEKMGKSKMHVLLTDPYYHGVLTWNGKQYPGKHEPLITKGLFNRVQEMMEQQRSGTRTKRHNPLFKGLLHCVHCSGLYTWELQKGHWYGHCNYYRKCTHRKYVRQEVVESQINALLAEMSNNVEPFADWLIDALKENHRAERELHDAAVSQLQKRYEQLQNRLDAIYDDKLDGRITQDMYDRKFVQYTAERDKLVSDLERHTKANTNYFELASRIIDLSRQAAELYRRRSETEKRQLLSLAFSNLQMDREKLVHRYEKPFALLASKDVSVSKRAGRDSNPRSSP
jgi:site-specific DNA recombinase